MGASKKNRNTAKAAPTKPVPTTKAVTPSAPPADVSAEYKRLLVLWVVALLITGVQFFIAYRWFRPTVVMGDGAPTALLIGLAILALGEFAVSIWLWRNVMLDAEKRKDLVMAQKGYFTAWILCLAAGPLGYVIASSDDGRFYYGFFILAALGVLYHQPARDLLVAAAPPVKVIPPPAPLVKTELEPAEPEVEADQAESDAVAEVVDEGEADANATTRADG